MKRFQRRHVSSQPDATSALLATVGLMLLLLPVLMVTSSAQRLTASTLQLIDAGGATPPHAGPLASVEVLATDLSLTVVALVQRSDVRARAEDAERRVIVLPSVDGQPDLQGLQQTLRRLTHLDPTQQRIAVRPSDEIDVSTWVSVMDAVRQDASGDLFPQVAVEDPR